MSKLARPLGFAIYLFAASLAGLEVLLRVFFSDPNYYWNSRYLFASQGAFVNVAEDLWTYAPKQQIRSVAVYGFPGSSVVPALRYRIEYDCLYKTNNLGLLQQRDIHRGDRVILVLGDSFTEGQGGCPWFSKLEARMSDWRLVNGGLQGSGPSQWRNLAEHLQSLGVHLDHIIVVAISNDFKRGAFAWSQAALRCMNDFECNPGAFWAPLHPSESAESILERAQKRGQARLQGAGQLVKVHEVLRRLSYAYSFVSPGLTAMIGRQKATAAWLHPDAQAAMAALRNLDRKLHVVLVPQRDEVGRRKKNHDSLLVEQLLNQMSVPFEWCILSSEHYMPLDGHPNAAGYEVLSACVETRLRQLRKL